MIDKRISTSDTVSGLDIKAQLIFTWSIPHADDFGLLPFNQKRLKAEIVPLLDLSLEDFGIQVESILEAKLWEVFEWQNEKFFRIPNFTKYQTLKNDRKPVTLAKNITSWKDWNPTGFQSESQEKLREAKTSKAKTTFSTSSATANAVASNSEKGEIPPLRVGTSPVPTPPGGFSKTLTIQDVKTETDSDGPYASAPKAKSNKNPDGSYGDPEVSAMINAIRAKTGADRLNDSVKFTRNIGQNLVSLKNKLGAGQFWFRFDKLYADEFHRKNFTKPEYIYREIGAYAPSDPLEEICLRLKRIISGFCSNTPDDGLSKIISDNVGEARIKKHNLESVINCYRSASNGIEFEVEKLRTLATPEFIKKLDDILAEDGITIYNTDVAPLGRGCLIKKNT